MLGPDRTIAVASDHGGFLLKTRITAYLREKGYEVLDLGAQNAERTDYPEYGYALARTVADGKARFGIAVCGSGIGMNIALNRNPKIRAAQCHDVTTARLSRAHTDANVLTLGERLTGEQVALDCVDVFLATAFDGGRHEGRIAKLGEVQQWL